MVQVNKNASQQSTKSLTSSSFPFQSFAFFLASCCGIAVEIDGFLRSSYCNKLWEKEREILHFGNELHFFACVPGGFDIFTTIRVVSIRFSVFPIGQRGRAIFYEMKSVAICQIFHGYNRKFELHDCACSWLLSAFELKTVLARNIHWCFADPALIAWLHAQRLYAISPKFPRFETYHINRNGDIK